MIFCYNQAEAPSPHYFSKDLNHATYSSIDLSLSTMYFLGCSALRVDYRKSKAPQALYILKCQYYLSYYRLYVVSLNQYYEDVLILDWKWLIIFIFCQYLRKISFLVFSQLKMFSFSYSCCTQCLEMIIIFYEYAFSINTDFIEALRFKLLEVFQFFFFSKKLVIILHFLHIRLTYFYSLLHTPIVIHIKSFTSHFLSSIVQKVQILSRLHIIQNLINRFHLLPPLLHHQLFQAQIFRGRYFT